MAPHTSHTLSYEAAKHLANLAHTLRPEWDHAGILHALRPLVPIHTAQALAIVVIHAATNRNAKTPHAIQNPGPWWNHTKTPDPTPPAASARPERPEPCPIDHHAKLGKYQHNCPECRLTQDFPPQIDRHVYDKLHPTVQQLIDRNPTTVVLS